ncbi:MAG: Aminodeoxychorismate lyase [Parcubacteria group bacterium GW2011_GWB1_38_8]|nr:MAG: Aminodeoxychorismate lyase [Parcubacteria group bacterium GW2011_GWB1_38_8]
MYRRFINKRIYLFIFVMFFLITCLWYITPPFSFPSGSIITIPEGVGLYVLTEKLQEDNVIRSPFWFRLAAIVLGGERDMKAGQYYMSRPQNTFLIAWRVFHGHNDIETVKLTIPEGFTVAKISNLFDDRFPFFDHDSFKSLAPEGYLFPDTYFIPVTVTASSTIKLLNNNFVRKVSEVINNSNLSGKTPEEIIIMASLIEGEARSQIDREIVSGILWRRVELGLPLQVDASFAYVNGKTTKDLTLDDLKIDSLFNTYLYKGLPPRPISNPGLESIKAAINPTSTPYLYFLTGDDGTMHYSEDFDDHVAKKFKYISR